MIFEELLSLPNLTKAQAFCIYELLEIIVIGYDKNLMFVTLLIVVPGFKDFNNGQEPRIVSFILSLCKNHLFKKIGY